jgi:Uma2 family endonuclease
MAAQRLHRWTADEYLAFEAKSDMRHEFFDGQIYDMAGGTEAHALIILNIAASFNGQLRRRPCKAYASEMLVEAGDCYAYPDVTVVCGQSQIARRNGIDVLLNPTLIVEVLSPSTEKADRETKFDSYRGIVDFCQYVLVSQHKPRIECYTRDSAGTWAFNVVEGIDAVLELTAIGCTLALRDVYDKVTFESAQED